MTETGAKSLIARICGSYMLKPGPGYVEAWMQALHGLDDSRAHDALTRHVRDSDRPPKPSDILRIATGLKSPTQHDESPVERMERLNRMESLAIKERLARKDEREISFQRFMRRKLELAGRMTPELEAYFHRIGIEREA